LFAAAGIGAAPILALLLLAISGAAATGPALLAMAGVAGAALGLALLWTHDLARVASALRRAAGHRAHPLPHSATPRLPLLAELARGAERLLHAEATRAARAQAEQHAEAEILERLPDPLVVLDADFRVRRANAAARSEFGAEAATALRHPTLRAAIDRALAEGRPQIAELMFPIPVPREFQATVTLLGPAPGNQVVILLADRTRERAVERMRADFVANAGHELRTPLASLIGFIDTLRGPAADDPAAQRRFLGIMTEQAARMRRVIDDLLGLSRIELMEHQRPSDRVNLAELASRVASGFEPALVAQKAALAVEIDPALPPVFGDADQLAQVLQNLLDNALKYGGEGVGIRLAAEPARPDEHWPARPGVTLVIVDTGPGIAREHLPRLTERFYRVDAGRSRAAGGTGLGLAIVKHIVNRHRGQLRIESTLGTGTTVRVWLPTG
jgi:two-component system, OmpR family, phosphate regulon sensor histidine kinase PhoR